MPIHTSRSLRTTVAFAAALAASACRPAVETQAKCQMGGDLSCPTGFHCGPAGTCVAGEPAPAVVFTALSSTTVGAFTDVEIVASSPRGLASWTLTLESTRGTVDVPLTPHFDGEGQRSGRFTARAETWRAGEGAATLVARIVPATAPLDPAEARLPVTVALPAFEVAFVTPAEGAAVRGNVAMSGRTASEVPVQSCTFQSGTLQAPAVLAAADGATDATATLGFVAVADGETALRLDCTDSLGRTAFATRTVLVENTALGLDVQLPQLVTSVQPAMLRVVATKSIPEPPTVTASGTHVSVGAVQVRDPKTFDYPLTGVPDFAGQVRVDVAATDRFGDPANRTVNVNVDASAPTGTLVERRALMGADEVDLTCDEEATYRIETTGQAAMTGLCGATTVTRVLAAPLERVVLVDAVGNERTLPPTLVREELAPELGETKLPVSLGFSPFRAVARPATTSARTDTSLSTADGFGLQVANAAAPSQHPFLHPLGRIREPVPVSQALEREGRTHLLVAAGPGRHHWAELDGNGSAEILWPYAALGDGKLAPTFDPRTGEVIASRDGALVAIGLHGAERAIRRFTLPAQASGLQARVCGSRLWAVGTSPGLVLSASLDETSDAAGMYLLVDGSEPLRAHLFCDAAEPVLLVQLPGSTQLRTARFDGQAWHAVTLSGPEARVRPLLGTTYFGGGRAATGDAPLTDLYELRDGSFQLVAATSTVAREDGAVLRRADGAIVIGGLNLNANGALVLKESLGFVDDASTRPAAGARGTFDLAANRLVALEGTTATSNLWEWSAADGWRVAATLPRARAGAMPVYETASAKVLIVGGTTQSGDLLDDELFYDAATGSLNARWSPIRASHGTATAMGQRRIGVSAQANAGSWATAYYDLASQVLTTTGGTGLGGTFLQRPASTTATLLKNESVNGAASTWSVYTGSANASSELLFGSPVSYSARGLFLPVPWTGNLYLTDGALRSRAPSPPSVPVPLPDFPASVAGTPAMTQVLATEVPGTWAMRVWAQGLRPSIYEYSEYAAGAVWVALPAGELSVSVCATDNGSGQQSTARAWIATATTLELLTPESTDGTCAKWAFDRTFASPAALVVSAAGEPQRTLVVDELHVVRTERH